MTTSALPQAAGDNHRRRGGALFSRGLLKAAMEEFRIWLDEARRAGDNVDAALAENALGVACLEEASVDEALKYFQSARRRLAQGPRKDDVAMGKIEANLGSVLWHLGQYGRSERHLRRALVLLNDLDDEVLRGRVLMWLGGLHLDLGAYREALKRTNEALVLFERSGAQNYESMACTNLGITHGALAEYRRAQGYFERALAAGRALGDQKQIAYTYTEMARVYYLQSDYQLAMHFCNRSLVALFSDVNALDREEVGQVSLVFALIFEAIGQVVKGMIYARRASHYYGQLRARGRLAEADAVLRRLKTKLSDSGQDLEGIPQMGDESLNPSTGGKKWRRLTVYESPKDDPARPDQDFSEQELRFHYLDTFLRFADAIEAKDPYTRGHSERVTAYALKIAEAMDVSQRDRDVMALAGRLHDVGKVSISSAILNKPGALTAEEYETIQRHPVTGVDMTRFILTSDEAVSLVKHHHERYDGTGYPEGLKGETIPFLTRILSVADAYDAMTTDRAYRQAFPHSLAMEKLREEVGRQFDPGVVAAFSALHEVGPDQHQG
ncbi:MAG: HD domain-containing phosphohydrolase [Bacillota bacterium]